MTACLLTFNRAARSSNWRNIPSVKSTFTRWMGLTTVNLLVKNDEMSSPRDAISAISSALGDFLDVFGIALLLLFRCCPGGDEVVVFAFGIVSDFENY